MGRRRGARRDPVRVVRLATRHRGRAHRELSVVRIINGGLRRHRRAALRTSGPTTVAWLTTVALLTTAALLITVVLLPTLLPTIALRASLLATVAAAATARAGPTILRVWRPTPDSDLPAGDLQLAGSGRAKILRRKLRPDGAREKALHLEQPKHCGAVGCGCAMGGWWEAVFDASRFNAARFNAARFNAARFDAARFDAARIAPSCSGLAEGMRRGTLGSSPSMSRRLSARCLRATRPVASRSSKVYSLTSCRPKITSLGRSTLAGILLGRAEVGVRAS